MRAGRLNRTLILARRKERLGEYREEKDRLWKQIAIVRGQVITLSTEEFLREAGQVGKAAVVFRVRWRPDFQLDDRLELDGVKHRLVEVKEIVRRRVLELRCVTELGS